MAASEVAGRTTPYGMWRYGNDFRRAANDVLSNHRGKHFMPWYFLIGQSIELSLKAFLLGRGETLEALRSKKFGHDLRMLVQEAKRRKLGTEVQLDPIHLAGIELLSFEFKSRRFQYIETGMMHLPEQWIVDEAAEMLSSGLEEFCRKRTKW